MEALAAGWAWEGEALTVISHKTHSQLLYGSFPVD